MSREPIRDLMARGSLGCPNTPQCGHLLADHAVDDWDGNGDPVNPRCPQPRARAIRTIRDVRRIDVAVSQDMVQAIERVIERERVSLTEAVRRLICYGDFVYEQLQVESRRLLTTDSSGGDVRNVVLIDQDIADA